MKTKEEIVLELSEISIDYEVDASATCKRIDRALTDNGFVQGGGEMARVERWYRGEEFIMLSYDSEHNRVGISSD